MRGNSTTTSIAQIDALTYIQNVGRFESVQANPEATFRPLTLVYSENGRGKTTVCAMLRSLTSGNPMAILERRRLSATAESKVVVSIAGSAVSFDGQQWSAPSPPIAIFDDHFVDNNVHSGLNVDAGHRKGVHELVVGEQGVSLQRQVEKLTSEISLLQNNLRSAERTVPAVALGSFSIDKFCDLRPVRNIEQQIEESKRSLSVLRDGDKIRLTSEFRPFALPSFDENELADLLGATLADVESAALNAVTRHISALGVGAEDWISRGLQYLGDGNNCPLCGQDASGSTLVSHYRAYFSKAYATHKRRIRETRDRLAREFSGDRLANLQRVLQEEHNKRDFWANYFEPPAFGIDLESLTTHWTNLRSGIIAALDRKGDAPLEPVLFCETDRDAMARYRDLSDAIRSLSTSFVNQNSSVRQVKEHATQGNTQTSQARLELLQTIQRRFQPAVDATCKAYLEAREKKTEAEREKVRVRAALDRHRHLVFGAYEAAINSFLDTFNADFTLRKLRPADARGVPSSTYSVCVNNQSVSLNPSLQSGPTFRTTLSAGDRSTLALAFFFASLKQRDLRNTIVVIDDPISSLDDARAFATAQEIRKLEGQCRQLIVLSHSRNLLCQLWETSVKNATATLEIVDEGADRSTLVLWDIEAAAATEFDRLHRIVHDYGEDAQGDPQQVAPALRILLESFLRVAFVAHFPPGRQLGQFVHRAKQLLTEDKPILSAEDIQELSDLNEYARLFHHSTHQAGWLEALANINRQSLRGYARRVLRFITLDGRIEDAQALARTAGQSLPTSSPTP